MHGDQHGQSDVKIQKYFLQLAGFVPRGSGTWRASTHTYGYSPAILSSTRSKSHNVLRSLMPCGPHLAIGRRSGRPMMLTTLVPRLGSIWPNTTTRFELNSHLIQTLCLTSVRSIFRPFSPSEISSKQNSKS